MNQTECFSRNFKFWKYLGIWPAGSFKYYNFYMVAFIVTICIVYDLLFTINFYFLPNQLDSFIEGLIFYFTELAVLSKVLTFFFMYGRIEEILRILDSDYFQPKTVEETIVIEKAKKFNVKYYNIVAVVSLLSHVTHICSPLLTHLFLSAPLTLPVCSYSFLSDDFKESFIYPLYLYQAVGMNCHLWYNVNIDTFFLGVMILTIAQLDILDNKLRSVTDNVQAHNKSRREVFNKTEEITKLNECIKHFDEIGKFISLIQQVFNVTLFVQFSMASAIICVCVFRFTLPAPFAYYIFLATYMFVMIIQILVPCWFGTLIVDKSNSLSQSVYSCDWIPKSRYFKSNMRLFVERTMHPLTIIGWKLFPLSLRTFTSIINTAYSFFTLLRYMQTRQ